MHEALAYAGYIPDTAVADVDDYPAPAPKPARVPTEELTVHVYVMGKWHRRTPSLSHTGCGKSIDTQRSPLRREQLVGDLCAGENGDGINACFTAFERLEAAKNNRKEFEP